MLIAQTMGNLQRAREAWEQNTATDPPPPGEPPRCLRCGEDRRAWAGDSGASSGPGCWGNTDVPKGPHDQRISLGLLLSLLPRMIPRCKSTSLYRGFLDTTHSRPCNKLLRYLDGITERNTLWRLWLQWWILISYVVFILTANRGPVQFLLKVAFGAYI